MSDKEKKLFSVLHFDNGEDMAVTIQFRDEGARKIRPIEHEFAKRSQLAAELICGMLMCGTALFLCAIESTDFENAARMILNRTQTSCEKLALLMDKP